MTAAEPSDVAGRSTTVSRRGAARAKLGSASAERAADAAVAAMYAANYRSLVSLAVLLVRYGDAGTAENVVQDSFVALHRNWYGLVSRDGSSDRALVYLWQSVVKRCRSAGQHPEPGDAPCAGRGPGAVVAALHALPARQREVLVLQHYMGLTAAQAARMLGISTEAVRRHTAAAMSALRSVLEREP